MTTSKKIWLLGLGLFLASPAIASEEDVVTVIQSGNRMDDYIMSGNIEYLRDQSDKGGTESNPSESTHESPEVSRLKQKIEFAREQEDLKAEADALLALTQLYMSDGYPTGPGLLSLQRYHEVMKDMADEMGLAVAYRNSGVVFYREGDFEQALNYYLKATEIFESLNHKKESANMYYNIGLLFSKLGNERNAQTYYVKCLRIREAAGDMAGKASVFKALALLHKRAGSIDISISYYDKLIATCRGMDNPYKLASAYNNKGVALKEAARYREAASYYHLALKQLQDNSESDKEAALTASIYENIGILLRYDNRPDEAMVYYNRALEVRSSMDDQAAISDIYANMANIMQERKKLDEAIALYKKCEEIESDRGDRQSLVATYGQLASLYKEKSNIKRALYYQEKFTSLQMALLEENRNNELITMQHQYELQKKNREISRLNAENQIQQAAIKQEKDLRTTWLFGTLGVILLTLLTIAVFRHRTEVKKLKALAGMKG
ncbi:tetratricopeptide repeat protein [Roseivirga sp. BDSF3-8]|uniref:tetratricopeptide repeat protein n=1 Tax=Roseivirga sp. BDSF3-8 TaxID=3241598 RepID=UPI003531806F